MIKYFFEENKKQEPKNSHRQMLMINNDGRWRLKSLMTNTSGLRCGCNLSQLYIYIYIYIYIYFNSTVNEVIIKDFLVKFLTKKIHRASFVILQGDWDKSQ